MERDANHAEAARLMREVADLKYGPPAVSDYVFDETVTVTLARTGEVRQARLVGESMLESFVLLRVDERVFPKAWRRFKAQKTTRLSFTDSTTIELMQLYGIKTLATFDREFASSRDLLVLGPR